MGHESCAVATLSLLETLQSLLSEMRREAKLAACWMALLSREPQGEEARSTLVSTLATST